jgi:phosphoribosyl 1,2-cyclic phosphodiesterase
MKPVDMRLKIYGVRGSYPPTNEDLTQFGVNTTCLRLDVGKHLIVFDAGTGIINLGTDLMGFPYFSMLYLPQTELHIIAPTMMNKSIEEVIDKWMSPEFFPVSIPELGCTFKYHEFGENRKLYFFEEDFKIIPVKEAQKYENWIGSISCIRNFTHPRAGSYIYKIETKDGKSIVLATDIEGFRGGDQRLINFVKHTNILIHDAQYTLEEYQMFQGFGHSTYEMACEVAAKAEVEKLILFHHDPKHSDEELKIIEKNAKSIFPRTSLAKESMEITLS